MKDEINHNAADLKKSTGEMSLAVMNIKSTASDLSDTLKIAKEQIDLLDGIKKDISDISSFIKKHGDNTLSIIRIEEISNDLFNRIEELKAKIEKYNQQIDESIKILPKPRAIQR